MTGILTPIFGEDLAPIANLVVGFLVIVLAVFVCLWLWRRVSGGSFAVGTRARRARLGVLESAPVDSRRRLLLVRRDDVGHLILTGGPSDVVVENNIDLSGPQSVHPVQPAAVPVEPAKPKPAVKELAGMEEQAPKPAEPAPQPKKPAEVPPAAPKSQPKEPVPNELTAPPVVAAATAAAATRIDTSARTESPVAADATVPAREVETGPSVKQADPPMAASNAMAGTVAPVADSTRETATADDQGAHELDPELLQELQATLNKKPDAAGAEAETDASLEREMSKLLNNLSASRSG